MRKLTLAVVVVAILMGCAQVDEVVSETVVDKHYTPPQTHLIPISNGKFTMMTLRTVPERHVIIVEQVLESGKIKKVSYRVSDSMYESVSIGDNLK